MHSMVLQIYNWCQILNHASQFKSLTKAKEHHKSGPHHISKPLRKQEYRTRIKCDSLQQSVEARVGREAKLSRSLSLSLSPALPSPFLPLHLSHAIQIIPIPCWMLLPCQQSETLWWSSIAGSRPEVVLRKWSTLSCDLRSAPGRNIPKQTNLPIKKNWCLVLLEYKTNDRYHRFTLMIYIASPQESTSTRKYLHIHT